MLYYYIMSRKNNAKKQHRPLTDRQKKFVLCYIANGLNALRAAIEAGYSEKTANNSVKQLLGNIGIQNEIARRTAKTTAKLEVTAERVIQEYARIAFAEGKPDYIKLKSLDGLAKCLAIGSQQAQVNVTNNVDARTVTLQQLPPAEQQSEVNRILGVIKSVGYQLPAAVQVDEVLGRYNNTIEGEIVELGASCEAESPNKDRTNAVEGDK